MRIKTSIAAGAIALAAMASPAQASSAPPSVPCSPANSCYTCATVHRCAPVRVLGLLISVRRPSAYHVEMTWGQQLATIWHVPCRYARSRAVLYVHHGPKGYHAYVFACHRIYRISW